MGFREKNGEEFDQVKVALVPVFETNMPDEFVLGGHVVVSDHAAVPPRAELHADKSPYEMVRGRGGGMRVLRGRGGITGAPSLPMGQRGLRGWSLPAWGSSWGETTRGHLIGVPSCHPPRTLRVGTIVGEEGAGGAGWSGGWGGSLKDRVRPAMGVGPACGMG